MEARIVGFRGSDRHPDNRHCIVETSDKNPASLIGQRVSWRTPSGMPISGKIIATHARDKLIARFSHGLPGIALGSVLTIGKVGLFKRIKRPKVPALIKKPEVPPAEVKEEVEKKVEKVEAVKKEVAAPAKKARAPKKKVAKKEEKEEKKVPKKTAKKPKAKRGASKS